MNRITAFLAALMILLIGGLVHGLHAERWRKSEELSEAVERLINVPLDLGGWLGTDLEVNVDEYAQAGASAYISRVYRKNNQEMQVILMVGRAGRMAVHTPEVCYRGAGFEPYGVPTVLTPRKESGEPLGTLWSLGFLKPGAATTRLQLYWSWSDGEAWQAPDRPRWAFAGRPFLYKLYMVQNQSGLSSVAAAAAREDFVQTFLPALNQSLRLKVAAAL